LKWDAFPFLLNDLSIRRLNMKTILTKFVNHQLTSVFFGFFLTGILGFFLSNNYLEEQKENEKRFFIASENRKAINDISRMIYE